MFNSLAEDLSRSTGTESEPVSFKDPEDSEDAPLILFAAIIIFIITGTIIFSRISAKKLTQVDDDKDYTIPEENEDLDSTE